MKGKKLNIDGKKKTRIERNALREVRGIGPSVLSINSDVWMR
jgi:hypothetical protein